MATFNYVEEWWNDNPDLVKKCVDDPDRSVADRLKEHIRVWLGAYTEYWTGVKSRNR